MVLVANFFCQLMSLTPELRRYTKNEGLDATHITHQITIFSKERKKEKKKSPMIHIVESADKLFRSSVHGFFDSLTSIRTHAPNAIKKFSWEKWYFEEYPHSGDPRKRTTWKELKEKDIDAKQMFILFLQNRYVVSEKMLLNLADQARTEENQRSWVFFNEEIQRVLRNWIDHEWPTAISQGIAKGLISTVPQHPGKDALFFLGSGSLATFIGSDQSAKRDNVGNHIGRMGSEFALLLNTHYLSHQRSLASFTDFSSEEISEMSQRMFHGSRLDIESTTVKTEAKAAIGGVALAQVVQESSSGSLLNALVNLTGPVLAAIYLYHKIKKEKSGEAVNDYIDTQTQLLEKINQVTRFISSQRGRGISVDLEATGISAEREALVKEIQQSNRRVLGPLVQTPLLLAGGTTIYDLAHASQLAPGAQSLVTGGIIVASLSQLVEEFTRRRNAEVKNREIARVKKMIHAIDTADRQMPRYIPHLYGEMYTLSREEALQRTNGPMIIHQVDIGYTDTPPFSINVAQPISLEPGVSLVKAPSGKGKSTLLRLLALEDGYLQNIHIQKGIDLRKIGYDALYELIYLVEANYRSSSLTIAEQMKPFITDRNSLLYQRIMQERTQKYFHLRQKYGQEHFDKFFATFSERADWLQAWVEDPLGNSDDPEVEIASTLLTEGFFNCIHNKYLDVKTPEQAAEYLKRKPGAMQGTSTGEAQRLEILKAFLKERKVILLDEPTANLDGGDVGTATDFIMGKKMNFGPRHSLGLVTGAIIEYMKKFPDTVIIIASNDPRLESTLKIQAKSHLRQEIYRSSLEDNQHIVWRSRPFKRQFPFNT